MVEERSRVHLAYIVEQEKTKRLSLLLAGMALISACLVFVFAPDGRENISGWTGAALLVFSAGAAGYKRVWGKGKMGSFGADQAREEHQ